MIDIRGRESRNKITPFLGALFFVSVILPGVASAHQPRIVSDNPVYVTEPEVSKAYYDTLAGESVVYRIVAAEPFELYVNVLVPDIAEQKKDVSALITKDGNEIASLEGSTYEWKKFFEEFGYDSYWMGPEYRARAEAGTYEVRVWSSDNDSKYSLAIGEKEAFDFKESLNAYTLIPLIKRDFFNESPATFIFSPLGWGLVVVVYIAAFAVGFAYRFALKLLAKGTVRGAGKNIGVQDRLLRLFISVALLAFAITTSWNPLVLFIAGFALFEAIFSWCGFYAALGKSTCPIN